MVALRNLCRPIQKAPMRRFPLVIALILSLAACSGEKAADSEPSASPTTAVSAASVPANAPVILAFGDSLYAGYQLRQDESYPAKLQVALNAAGTPVKVMGAGVSGDTTAAGCSGWPSRSTTSR